MPSWRTPRRDFLHLAAGAALASASVPRVLAAANGKLQHACIGVGGMGHHDLHQFLSHPRTQVVAVCDVDENHLKRAVDDARKKGHEPRAYVDWRELLAKEGAAVDSVNITVPDHMHAAITLAALAAGKHVYCQKPLTHDVAESREVMLAAKAATGRVTQLGAQHGSGAGDRTAVHWIREGVVGEVSRVILCSNRPRSERYRLKGPRPEKGEPTPKHLHWDLWLGTAPERPYAPSIYHPTFWRAWQDFGTGWSGDIGCHIFDAVWKGLGLTAPTSVFARVQDSWRDDAARRADTWPQSDHITWTFPGNKLTGGKEIPVEWFDGAFFPPADVQARCPLKPYPHESSMVIGSEGAVLLPHGKMPLLLPVDKFKDHPASKQTQPGWNHYHHFADACLGGPATETHFLHAGPMTEAILLGTVAIRVPGERLDWDAQGMRFPKHPQADAFLKRTYREGFKANPTQA